MDAKVSGARVVSGGYHTPVLLEAAVGGLVWDPAGLYVDATFGGGGHSREILRRLTLEGRLIGIDKDPEAPLETIEDVRFVGVRGDFRDLEGILHQRGIVRVSGILADLGVSSHQVDTIPRGFSYRGDAPLDLRMDPTQGMPAWEWLGQQREQDLAFLLRSYGDLPRSQRLAGVILRHWQPYFTTQQLVTCARAVYGSRASDYLAPLFQALRIAINDEFGALQALLTAADRLIVPGGRLVVLTYHSGEVRRLRAHLRQPAWIDQITGQYALAWRLLHKVSPSPEEVARNPRSRSAILWIAEKV